MEQSGTTQAIIILARTLMVGVGIYFGFLHTFGGMHGEGEQGALGFAIIGAVIFLLLQGVHAAVRAEMKRQDLPKDQNSTNS